MNDLQVTTLKVQRFEKGGFKATDDIVCREKTLALVLNGREVGKLTCLDRDIPELARGFLAARGYLNPHDLIVSLSVHDDRVEVVCDGLNSDDPEPPPPDNKLLSPLPDSYPQMILRLMDAFAARTHLFTHTGGVHSGALATLDGVLFYTEDISRHNVLDKVVGHHLMHQYREGPLYYVTTGRVNSEIVEKLARTPLAGVISKSAVTERAVHLSATWGLHLFGFVREGRFTQY